MSNILKRLEALEAARNGGGLSPAVSLLMQGTDGLWELSCGLCDGKKDSRTERSTHHTEAEARAAYDVFLKNHRRGKLEPVLIIDDL